MNFYNLGCVGGAQFMDYFIMKKKKNGGCHLDELIRDVQVGLGVDYFVV